MPGGFHAPNLTSSTPVCEDDNLEWPCPPMREAWKIPEAMTQEEARAYLSSLFNPEDS
jgi:hypothetical protein